MSGGPVIRRRAAAPHACDFPPHVHPVLRRVYAGREVASAADIECALPGLLPPERLAGCEAAAVLLHDMLEGGRRILILGDFDADGATSCALAVRALRALGARDVHYLVPNRFEYGYGLTPEIVGLAASMRPDLIVTVDNGISSLEGVDAARARGMKVLVTDHHLPGPELPAADVIVDPNQPGDDFPSKHLAGVGVIFYVMLALRKRLRETGWFARHGIEEPRLDGLLDLVALGTVADVARLDLNNRILVAQGLRRIRAGRACAGIRALIEVSGRQAARLCAADLGYALGPRLNAAGRLEDMSFGIECLLTDDEAAARAMATRLDELNTERRRIEREMKDQALAALDGDALDASAGQAFGVCLYHEDWHQGVIGILASRIKERLHRPVVAFAPAGDAELKGSARSVTGLHIRDCLEAIASRHPGLVPRFGGHAMAAGLSLRVDDYPRFRDAFDEEVRRRLGPEDLQGVIYSDGELAADELSVELAEALQAGGPWGHGFPEPVFDGAFEVEACRLVGERHLKLTLRAPGSARRIEAIAFDRERDFERAASGESIRIAYRLDINEFRGRVTPQLVIEHIDA